MAITGCANFKPSAGSEQATLGLIELAAYELGFYIGKSKTDTDDKAIADAYALARTGTLSPEQVASAFNKLKIDRPELTGGLMIVLKRMGAAFAPGTMDLVSLSGVPVLYWDTAADGYMTGYSFGKMNQKAISAVALVKR